MSLKLTKINKAGALLTRLLAFGCLVSHGRSSRKDFECITTGYSNTRLPRVFICASPLLFICASPLLLVPLGWRAGGGGGGKGLCFVIVAFPYISLVLSLWNINHLKSLEKSKIKNKNKIKINK